VNLPNLQGWFCGAGFPDVCDRLYFSSHYLGNASHFERGVIYPVLLMRLYLWVPQPMQTWGLPENLPVEIRMGLKPVGHDQPQEI
jgi:hypothetical protein